MAFQPCPNTIEMVCPVDGPGTVSWAFVLHYHLADATPLDQTIADGAHATVRAALTETATFWHTDVSFTESIQTDIRSEGAIQLTSTSGGVLTGSEGTGEALDPQNCIVVSWRSAFRGREGRGRTFLSGFTEDQVNLTGWSGGLVTAVQEFADDIADNGLFCLLSRFKGTEPAGSGRARLKPIKRATGVQHLLTSGHTDQAIRTQRRRRFTP